MWVAVEFTHHRGVKLGKGEQHPRGIIEGEVQTFALGRSHAVQLKPDTENGPAANMVAVQLIGIGPDVMQISGLERIANAWVRQQWICRLKERPRRSSVLVAPPTWAA